jgi:hypothetical protein
MVDGMNKFTPGPWSPDDEIQQCPTASALTTRFFYGPNRLAIFRMGLGYESDETNEANAHLIAAAPDMYEALDTLVAVVGLTAFKHEGQRQALQESVDLSVAALKKARGEI